MKQRNVRYAKTLALLETRFSKSLLQFCEDFAPDSDFSVGQAANHLQNDFAWQKTRPQTLQKG